MVVENEGSHLASEVLAGSYEKHNLLTDIKLLSYRQDILKLSHDPASS